VDAVECEFRFYEELNDFLPPALRKRAFAYRFRGTPAVKDAIEALGVPHTEVDLILVDGASVRFSHKLRSGRGARAALGGGTPHPADTRRRAAEAQGPDARALRAPYRTGAAALPASCHRVSGTESGPSRDALPAGNSTGQARTSTA
jgi:hypothetical protein